MKNKGLLLVISGPSGAGKGTVISSLMNKNESIHYSVSATTRYIREGEKNGINYFFLSKDEFEKEISNDGMLEYANYCGNYYGTPKKAVMEKLEAGIDVILEIEIQGALQIKKKFSDAVLIFIIPPKFSDIEKRLVGRNTESTEVIKKRIETAKNEINYINQYDYVVINDDVENAAVKIKSIISAEKNKYLNMKEYIEEEF